MTMAYSAPLATAPQTSGYLFSGLDCGLYATNAAHARSMRALALAAKLRSWAGRPISEASRASLAEVRSKIDEARVGQRKLFE